MTELKPCPFCGSKNVKLFELYECSSVICYDCNSKTDDYLRDEESAIKAWNNRPNPWHTGTPTEEGDYLVKLDVEHHDYPYYVLKWYKGGWYSAFDMIYTACPQHSVLKWQKIE